jgi:hypothetical protein
MFHEALWCTFVYQSCTYASPKGTTTTPQRYSYHRYLWYLWAFRYLPTVRLPIKRAYEKKMRIKCEMHAASCTVRMVSSGASCIVHRAISNSENISAHKCIKVQINFCIPPSPHPPPVGRSNSLHLQSKDP